MERTRVTNAFWLWLILILIQNLHELIVTIFVPQNGTSSGNEHRIVFYIFIPGISVTGFSFWESTAGPMFPLYQDKLHTIETMETVLEHLGLTNMADKFDQEQIDLDSLVSKLHVSLMHQMLDMISSPELTPVWFCFHSSCVQRTTLNPLVYHWVRVKRFLNSLPIENKRRRQRSLWPLLRLRLLLPCHQLLTDWL